MKEISIEEKAKAYDEVLGRARKEYKNHQAFKGFCEMLVHIFPELAESEDERIKQFLIQEVTETSDEIMSYRNMNKKDVLTWLEKQGEHANFRNKIQVGDKVTRNRDGVLVNLSQLNRVAKKDEKQGEQKPFDYENANITQKDFAPKVEPKFKVGDWIVYDDKLYHIGNIALQNCYECLRVDGTVHTFSLNIDNKSHLWTIKDAKDGDVLAVENMPFIYNGKVNPLSVGGYCGIIIDGLLKINEERPGYGSNGWTMFDTDIYPATKEQRDTLMKAMADAGYTFDFEKKELKKIEQRIADNIPQDFEKYVEHLLSLSDGEGHGSPAKVKEVSTELFKLAKLKQKPTWSEEDERIYQSIIDDTVQENQLNGKQTDWLRGIKYRYFPQPKQEWSEEDEKMHDFAIRAIGLCKQYSINHQVNEYSNLPDVPKKYEELQDWLKSFKDRYTWKPSEEQINNILDILSFDNCTPKRRELLESLYNDLKKLMEE